MDWVLRLRILGYATIAVGIIAGIVTGNEQSDVNRLLRDIGSTGDSPFVTGLTWALAGLLSSVVWFALAALFEHLERLEDRLTDLIKPPQPPPRQRRVSTGDQPSPPRRTSSGNISWPDR